MPMTHRTRKRLALLILLVGMPLWVVVAATVVGWMDRPSILVELAVYAGLGIVWVLPFRRVFLGVAQADPDQDPKGPSGASSRSP